MTRNKAVAIARDNLWQLQETTSQYGAAADLPQPQVAITESSLVNTLAALGLIKFDAEPTFGHQVQVIIASKLPLPKVGRVTDLADEITALLDQEGFQIVRKP